MFHMRVERTDGRLRGGDVLRPVAVQMEVGCPGDSLSIPSCSPSLIIWLQSDYLLPLGYSLDNLAIA